VKTKEEKIFFFPCFARPREEERLQSCSKRHRFGLLVFFLQCMKRRHFGQNAPFHLKEKGGKMCQSPNQSSICDLFNQVLICNFDLKNNAIASLPKIKQRP
jgi:hypothetical protein